MIGELFTLAKMLFGKTSLRQPSILVMKHFPFSGFSAMMWCGYIVTRKKEYELSDKTVRHEYIHVKQAYRYSRWYSYYLRYLREWMRGNPLTHPASGAYMTIPFEMEAYANEHLLTYEPTADTLKRYTIKNRKKTYRSLKGNRKGWIEYLQTL